MKESLAIWNTNTILILKAILMLYEQNIKFELILLIKLRFSLSID